MSNYANFEGTSFGSTPEKIQHLEELILKELESNAQQPQDSSEKKKPATAGRTSESVMILQVVRIEGKDGRVFYRAATDKGVFFLEGKVPEQCPCPGLLETRVTEDGKTYHTVYAVWFSRKDFRQQSKFRDEIFGAG
jgi:hypothetical protein